MWPSTRRFAEKRSYEEKRWQKYENLANIRKRIPGTYTRIRLPTYDLFLQRLL